MKFFKYLFLGFIIYISFVFITTTSESYYAEENDNNLRKHMKE